MRTMLYVLTHAQNVFFNLDFFFITQARSHSSRSLVASFLFSRRQNFYKFHFFLGLVIFSPFPSGGMRISSWPFENFPISNDGRRWNFNQRGKRLCKYEKYLFYIALLCVKYREIALISFYASEIFLSPTWRLYLEKFSWLVNDLARCVYTYSMLKSGYLEIVLLSTFFSLWEGYFWFFYDENCVCYVLYGLLTTLFVNNLTYFLFMYVRCELPIYSR